MFYRRERERQNQREELWLRVESLAARNPSYETLKYHCIEYSSLTTSPEQEEDLNLDNFEQEAQEVSQFFLYSSR